MVRQGRRVGASSRREAIVTFTGRDIQRFWSYVTKTRGCWRWDGQLNVQQYGRLRIKGRMVRVHRMSWCIHHGAIPPGLFVLHACDNPRCVRPDHLFLGTQTDNIRDMIQKGRGRWLRGDAHPNAKLTRKEVQAIRASYVPGVNRFRPGNSAELCHRYQIDRSIIHGIVNGTAWR